MNDQGKRFYEFGSYRLDAVDRRLLRDGEPVQLTPKAFDTLLALVEHSGKVIAKDELMKRVWPDSFVEEGNLTVNISMLRKALGESPNQRQYIVTVPGRGYRFAANVRELLNEATDLIVEERTRSHVVIEREQEVSDEARAAKSMRASVWAAIGSRWKVAAASLILFAIVASAMIWKLWLKPQAQSMPVLTASVQIAQLASWKMETGAPATVPRFSRDGKMVAFSSTRSGHSNIWIKQVMGGEPIQVTNGEWTDLTPIWSPDGQQIAFISDRGDQYGIWVSPSFGGPTRLLKIIEGDSKELRYWSKDGRTIYYEVDHNLFALDVAAGQASQVTSFDPLSALAQNFSVSPDEKQIAYADSKDGQFDIWVAPMSGGAPSRVTNDPQIDMHPAWHADGNRIVYSSNRGSAYQICVIRRDGSGLEQLTNGDSDSLVPDVSAGGQILYNLIKEEGDLWAVRPDGGKEFEVTSDLGLEFWPDVSADGKMILFQAVNGSEKLFDSSILTRPTGGAGRQIQVAPGGFNPRWSPDGSKLAYLRFSANLFNLWTVNAVGGEPKQLTTDGMTPAPFSFLPCNRTESGGFNWSPDGSQIAYCSKKSGHGNIWTVSADGLTHSRITDNADPTLAYSRPLWSPDGRRMASVLAPRFRSADQSNAWRVWLNDSGFIFQSHSYLRLVCWSLSGDGLIVASTRTREESSKPLDTDLFQISAGGPSRPIAALKLAYAANIVPSPDGRYIAFVSRADGEDNIWAIPSGGGGAVRLTANNDPRLYFSSLTWSPDSKTIYYGKQSRSSQVSMIDNFR